MCIFSFFFFFCFSSQLLEQSPSLSCTLSSTLCDLVNTRELPLRVSVLFYGLVEAKSERLALNFIILVLRGLLQPRWSDPLFPGPSGWFADHHVCRAWLCEKQQHISLIIGLLDNLFREPCLELQNVLFQLFLSLFLRSRQVVSHHNAIIASAEIAGSKYIGSMQ